MKALILAAGYAVRLYPLTKECPKPLLEIAHKSIIEYAIEQLSVIEEIDEIIIVTNSKFFPVFKKWLNKIRAKDKITLVDDLTKENSDRRGAIGDIHFVITQKNIRDDLLVIGGDNIFDGALKDFLSFAGKKHHHPAIGIYDINNRTKAAHYGVVKLDAQDKIVDFKEKPKKPQSTLIAMCLYYFPKTKLGLIKEYFGHCAKKCDAAGFYIDWLRKKVAVYGFVFGGVWYDIGHLDSYNDANRVFLNKEKSYASA